MPNEPSGSPRRELYAFLALLTALGVAQCAGAWRGWHLLGANDWNYYLGQTEAEIQSVLHWHQFPLWAPWKRGGQPLFAQPEAMLLSPFTLLALLTGTLSAYKLLLLPIFLLGGAGMWALAGHLGLRGVARAVPALLLYGSSVFPLYLAAGLPNWLCGVALLPWIVLAALRAIDDLRQTLRLAALLALVLFCGGLYPFAFLPVFLGLVMLAQAIARRSPRPLLVLGAAGVVAFALASPRLVPLLSVYEMYPRWHYGEDGFMTPELVWRAWSSGELPDLSRPRGPLVITADTGVYWSYVGAYVGPLGLALAAAGALAWRRSWRWLLPLAGATWLALGPWPRWSAWSALHELPFVGSMRASERLMVFATFCLALLGGLGWDALAVRARALWPGVAAGARRATAGVALAALLVPMVLVNAPIARHAFSVEPLPAVEPGPFHQAPPVLRPEQWGGECYDSVRANVGNPLAMSDIPTPGAVSALGQPDYKGEVWLLSGAGAVQAEITPNVIDVLVDVPAADTLVVNQNWFPGWRAEGAVQRPLQALSTRRNLLALPVPAGRHEITLRYAPPEVPHALVLGGLALLVAAAYAFTRKQGPVSLPGPPELLALAAFALLAVEAGLPRAPPAPPRAPDADQRWLAHAAIVQATSPDSPRGAQEALDAAPPGGLVVLRPGHHAGLHVTRDVVIMADPAGEVVLEGPLLVDDLPAGARVVLAGGAERSLRLAGGVKLRGGGTLLLQSALVESGGGEALSASGPAVLQLLDVVVSGALELRRASAQALDSQLDTVRLRDGATLLLTRTSTASVDADASSRAAPEAPGAPTVTVLESRFMRGSATVEVRGPPGLRGKLALATRPSLLADPSLDGWMLLDIAMPVAAVDVTLDDAGQARVRMRVPEAVQKPGAGLFAQLVWGGPDGRLVASRSDGRLFTLRSGVDEH
ncbi:MAG TPA: hypothetical protein VFY71_06050 [Planctomycetota bacterium]|nr:hypothetical protein [Planctomycetota bacterium]